MKATITVGFRSTIQATQYHPQESNDSLSVEVEYDSDEELMEKYEKYQRLIRAKSIKSAIEGANEFLVTREKLFVNAQR